MSDVDIVTVPSETGMVSEMHNLLCRVRTIRLKEKDKCMLRSSLFASNNMDHAFPFLACGEDAMEVATWHRYHMTVNCLLSASYIDTTLT